LCGGSASHNLLKRWSKEANPIAPSEKLERDE
jgi:hypothetical protein